jgi:hypothetical protein
MTESSPVQEVKDLLGIGWTAGIVSDHRMKLIDNIKIFTAMIESKFGQAESRFGSGEPGFHFVSQKNHVQFSLVPLLTGARSKSPEQSEDSGQWFRIFGHADEAEDFVRFLERNGLIADTSPGWYQVFLNKIHSMKR